jgi:hypothetical protein
MEGYRKSFWEQTLMEWLVGLCSALVEFVLTVLNGVSR